MNSRSNEDVQAEWKSDAEFVRERFKGHRCHHFVVFEYGKEPEQGDAIAALLVVPPGLGIPRETQTGQSIWRASITATSPFRLARVWFASLLDQRMTASSKGALTCVSPVTAS